MNLFWLQRFALVASDALSMLLAFILGILVTQFYHQDLSSSSMLNFFNPGITKFLGILLLLAFAYREHYSKRRPFWEELRQIWLIVGFLLLINLGLAFVLGKGSLKVLIIGFWLTFGVIAPFLRVMIKSILIKANLWQRDLYIIGTGETAYNAYKLFACNRLMGYKLVGLSSLSDGNFYSEKFNDIPILSIAELKQILVINNQCDIIIALDNNQLNSQINLINYLQHNCLSLLVVPEISGLALYGAEIDHFFGNDQLVLRLNNNLARNVNAIVKRLFDLLIGSVAILLLSPVFISIALIIRFGSKTSVFYRHQRIGKHGNPFYCLKFQSMYPNSKELLAELLANNPEAKAEWLLNFKLKNDPRVTPIGRWLRETSLDELPQLFNVLLGNMSLVGPRPIVNEEIARYEEGFYYYQLVLPGITGLWQVSGRSDTDYVDRVRLDGWYVKNWSLWYDIVILVKTVGVVLKRSGAY